MLLQNKPNTPYAKTVEDAENAEGTSQKEKPTPEEDQTFDPNAKIWSLYLGGAQEDARKRAKLWDTSMDTLLIFVRYYVQIFPPI